MLKIIVKTALGKDTVKTVSLTILGGNFKAITKAHAKNGTAKFLQIEINQQHQVKKKNQQHQVKKKKQ